MAKQEVYDYLREIGCCSLCCLRFFNGRADDYQDVQKSLESVSAAGSRRIKSTFQIITSTPNTE